MKYLAFAALVCACAAPAVQDDGPGDPPPLGPVHAHTVPPGEQEQGRHLLGNFADAWTPGGEFLAAVAPAGLSLNVSNGRIELRNSAGQLVSPLNRPLPTRRGGTLIIDGVDVTGAYHLRYIDPAGGGHDYCDPTENAYAVAMPGYWTAGRSHTGAGGTATFACQISGKAAACMAWGYNPDAGPGSSGWQLHQACIQMAMALYCGPSDAPHTREKTPIWIRDFVPGAQIDETVDPLPVAPSTYPPVLPPPDNVYFESAWVAYQPAQCLSHLRWASLPLRGPCPAVLHDPRVDPTATYCEDYHPDQPTQVLLVGSFAMDLELHRWRDSATGDTVTTAHGYLGDDKTAATRTRPPWGYDAPALGTEGYLLRHRTGDLLDDPTLFKVYRQHGPAGDTVLGPDGMLAGFTRDTSTADTDFEGWMFSAAKPTGTQPMYLWQRLGGGEYVTAAANPNVLLYKKAQTAAIGHVIAGPQ